MKLKVNIGELMDAIAQAKITLDHHSQMSTTHLFLRAQKDAQGKGALYLYSTNSLVETFLKIPAEVDTPGEVLVSPVLLAGCLMSRPNADDVTLELKDSQLLAKYKGRTFKLGTLSDTTMQVDKIARLPKSSNAQFKVPGADMTEFVRRGVFCVPTNSKGQTGQSIGGMYFTENEDGYEAQATDGAIATQIKIKAEKNGGHLRSFLLPPDSLTPVNQLCGRKRESSVGVIVEANPKGQAVRCVLTWEDAIFTSALLAGEFPQLKQIMDNVKATYRFQVKREELRDALSRCAVFAGSRRTIGITLEKGKLSFAMSSDASNEAGDFIEVEHAGDVPEDLKIQVAVNMDYLLNISTSSRAEKLLLGLTSAVSHVLVEDNSDERVRTKYVIMPVKIGRAA